MDFRDSKHLADELVFQGVEEKPPAALDDDAVLAALAKWQSRADATAPSPEAFHLEGARCFTISYQGEAGNYWPDEAENVLIESLAREFLFKDGICALDDLEPRLYIARYKVQALTDTEYLLACPYPTEAGNIAGVVVVCVKHYLKPGGRGD
ncbi:MAG: hypothetical protein AAFX10_04640 [Pseudomonadota bacterium]